MPIDHNPVSEHEQKGLQRNSRISKEVSQPFLITDPKYQFENVILTNEIKAEVNRVLSLTRNSELIFKDWNLESVIKHHNLSVNLYGASGTGKTMTAHAISYALNKKMVIVNYAEIESKYVGETSKNLVSLFDFAKQNDVVILFDEADALLSKRVTGMHSATDVSVNQTRNMLLKILDDYEGVVIFTTNFIENFDTAFMRRIFAHIKFELPDRDARKALWNHYLLSTLPINNREGVIEAVSEVDDLSGADISTIVLKAAIDAANSEEKVIEKDMLQKIIREVQNAKIAINGKYEITTRKVSEEYALQQIKGGIGNGFNQ